MTDTVNLEPGTEVFKDAKYGECGTIITITGRTPSGNYKASDGNVYKEPTGKVDEWTMWQRGGGDWDRQILRPLTDARREEIAVARLIRQAHAIRTKIGTPDRRNVTKAQAEQLLSAWRNVAAVVDMIEGK